MKKAFIILFQKLRIHLSRFIVNIIIIIDISNKLTKNKLNFTDPTHFNYDVEE